MDRKLTPAAVELGKIVHEIQSEAEAARQIGVSQTVLREYLAGRKRPKNLRRIAIKRWSKGRIKVSDWDYADERELLEKARPFSNKRARSQAAE